MIQKFDGDFPVSHLKFTIANDMPSNVYGQTLRPEDYITTIEINGESINEISNLGTALVLSHEVIHAEIYRKMLSVARKGDLNYRGWPRKDWDKYFESLQKDFPGIFDYYFRYEWETPSGQPLSNAQHEQMANYYISVMADILQKFDNHQHSRQFYEDISWVGLRETIYYENLSQSEKDRISNHINQYFYHER